MSSFNDKSFDQGTQLKLKIFRGYIREWLPVFLTGYSGSRSNFRRVNIFDFFAGPGKDPDGNPGSPLIIVNELKQFCQERGAIKASGTEVQLFFNDAAPSLISRLKTEVANVSCPQACCKTEFSALPFNEALQANLKVIQNPNSANLVIMDQCGIKEVTLEVVQQLAACRTTDILFFVSSSYMRRFADAPEFADKMNIEPGKLKNADYNEIHRFVCEYFRHGLAAQRYHLAPFSIRKGSNTYGVIFGSGNLLGLQKFLKICWNNDTVTGEANYNIDSDFTWNAPKSLFPALNVTTKETLFARALSAFIREKSPTNQAVYEFCLTKGFLPSTATTHLNQLRRDGTLEVTDLEPELPSKSGAFYLTWKEYNGRPPRVRFTMRSGSEQD